MIGSANSDSSLSQLRQLVVRQLLASIPIASVASILGDEWPASFGFGLLGCLIVFSCNSWFFWRALGLDNDQSAEQAMFGMYRLQFYKAAIALLLLGFCLKYWQDIDGLAITIAFCLSWPAGSVLQALATAIK